MSKEALGPTQTAYDRIQQAGTRSPINIGDVGIVYELRADGICIRGTRPTGYGFADYNMLVSWSELAMAINDPLVHYQQLVVDKLTARREAGHAVGD